jgi:hypothetical protein
MEHSNELYSSKFRDAVDRSNKEKEANIRPLKVKVKVKQSHYRPWGFHEVEAPRFQDNRHMKFVRLSAIRIGRLYPQEIFLVLTSVRG